MRQVPLGIVIVDLVRETVLGNEVRGVMVIVGIINLDKEPKIGIVFAVISPVLEGISLILIFLVVAEDLRRYKSNFDVMIIGVDVVLEVFDFRRVKQDSERIKIVGVLGRDAYFCPVSKV